MICPNCSLTLDGLYAIIKSNDGICAYRQISNISHIVAGNNIFDLSDVVGESPVGAAPTTSSFST